MDEHLLAHIPPDMPVPGQYNHESRHFPMQRQDIKVPNMKLYTPKALGRTGTRIGSYYKDAGQDSYDPQNAHDSQVDGCRTTFQKRTLTMADMCKYSDRNERMYHTVDLGANIALENTKDTRAEQIWQAREKKRQGYQAKAFGKQASGFGP